MRKGLWLAWGGASLAAAGLLAHALTGGYVRLFSPGPMTDAHHQIAEACGLCHREPFGGGELIQAACVDCHGEELAAADDSHPRSKFLDPRNAEWLVELDARYCVTCHTEHEPRITRAMAVTLARDFCVLCHADIGEERPTHAGAAFAGCAQSGCHNYHDNRALHEDFLAAHAGEPFLFEQASLPARRFEPLGRALDAAQANAPPAARRAPLLAEWAGSAHARGGVNCGDCHAAGGARGWNDRPGLEVCADCHGRETAGFLAGKHGMRLAAGLDALRPWTARLPMRDGAAERVLDCHSCHGAHAYDTVQAGVRACLACHADRHSLAYESSPHARLLGDGTRLVSCADCHLPVASERVRGEERFFVQHNQNANLRPREKMVKNVCLHCHGLEYALEAMADEALVRANFRGHPELRVESFEWVKRKRAAQAPR